MSLVHLGLRWPAASAWAPSTADRTACSSGPTLSPVPTSGVRLRSLQTRPSAVVREDAAPRTRPGAGLGTLSSPLSTLRRLVGQRVGPAHLVFLDGLRRPCQLICSSLIQGGVAAHIHLTDWETEAAGRQGKQLTEAHVTAELRDNGRLHALDLTFCTRLPPSVLRLYCLRGFPSKENA